MTADEQRIARMQVWERYELAKSNLATQRARMNGWQRLLQSLGNRLQSDPMLGIEQDYSKLPSYELFCTAVSELNTAKDEFSRTWKEAKENGFPVD